jgi:hypothetical protein
MNTTTKEKPKRKPKPDQQLAVPERSVTDVTQMLFAMTQQQITAESAGALREMVALYKDMKAWQAEREFSEAFANLQADLPKVQALRPVKNKNGTVRYCYAKVEDILVAVQPTLIKHRFTITFDNIQGDNVKTSVCILRHAGGHVQKNQFTVRNTAPPETSPAQGDGSTGHYAKRYALCDCLNIIIETQDDDARMKGKSISPEKAAELRQRVRDLKRDEAKFLVLAGVEPSDPVHYDDYNKILEGNLEMLEQALSQAEQLQKQGNGNGVKKPKAKSEELPDLPWPGEN